MTNEKKNLNSIFNPKNNTVLVIREGAFYVSVLEHLEHKYVSPKGINYNTTGVNVSL